MLVVDRSKVRRDTAAQRLRFAKARAAEKEYEVALRKVARHVGDIVEAFEPDDPGHVAQMNAALHQYSAILRPWARAAAARMLNDVARRDEAAWAAHSREIARNVRRELESAPLQLMRSALLAEQVALITSIPTEAARRVNEITVKSLYGGGRAASMVAEVMRSGEVARSRATLIARTEVGRTATAFTMARATHLGSTHYVWRSAGDRLVRPLHRKLDGSVHAWTDPPVSGERGERSHPGSIYNCFSGETRVSLYHGCDVAWRALYSGPVATVAVADGSTFEATPNHPILTRRGWVPALGLQEGDYLVKRVRDAGRVHDHDGDLGIPRFSDVFEALSFSNVPKIMRRSAESDFHGDVVHNHVDEVRADGYLPYDLEALGGHRRGDLVLAEADGGIAIDERHEVGGSLGAGRGDQFLAAALRRLRHPGEHSLATVTDLRRELEYDGVDVGRFHLPPSGDRVTAEAAGVVGEDLVDRQLREVAAVFRREALLVEASLHDPRLEADLLRGLAEREAASDESCRVLDKFVRHVDSLHVYTLQSKTGYFNIGRGLFYTKNCRCWAEPILEDAPPEAFRVVR